MDRKNDSWRKEVGRQGDGLMRGNHRIWGRNDYNEPAPMNQKQRDQIAVASVFKTPNRKTWYDVFLDGKYIGRVTSRTYGQFFRTPSMADYCLAKSHWNNSDPPHGWAILRLIELQ
jgi:hypothetical protein